VEGARRVALFSFSVGKQHFTCPEKGEKTLHPPPRAGKIPVLPAEFCLQLPTITFISKLVNASQGDARNLQLWQPISYQGQFCFLNIPFYIKCREDP